MPAEEESEGEGERRAASAVPTEERRPTHAAFFDRLPIISRPAKWNKANCIGQKNGHILIFAKLWTLNSRQMSLWWDVKLPWISVWAINRTAVLLTSGGGLSCADDWCNIKNKAPDALFLRYVFTFKTLWDGQYIVYTYYHVCTCESGHYVGYLFLYEHGNFLYTLCLF